MPQQLYSASKFSIVKNSMSTFITFAHACPHVHGHLQFSISRFQWDVQESGQFTWECLWWHIVCKSKKKISTFCGYAQVGMDPPSLEEYALKKPYQILSSYPNNRYKLFESIFLGE